MSVGQDSKSALKYPQFLYIKLLESNLDSWLYKKKIKIKKSNSSKYTQKKQKQKQNSLS